MYTLTDHVFNAIDLQYSTVLPLPEATLAGVAGVTHQGCTGRRHNYPVVRLAAKFDASRVPPELLFSSSTLAVQ